MSVRMIIDPHHYESILHGRAPWMALYFSLAAAAEMLDKQIHDLLVAFMTSDWAAICTLLIKAVAGGLALGYAYYGFMTKRKDYRIAVLKERQMLEEEKKRNETNQPDGQH